MSPLLAPKCDLTTLIGLTMPNRQTVVGGFVLTRQAYGPVALGVWVTKGFEGRAFDKLSGGLAVSLRWRPVCFWRSRKQRREPDRDPASVHVSAGLLWEESASLAEQHAALAEGEGFAHTCRHSFAGFALPRSRGCGTAGASARVRDRYARSERAALAVVPGRRRGPRRVASQPTKR